MERHRFRRVVGWASSRKTVAGLSAGLLALLLVLVAIFAPGRPAQPPQTPHAAPVSDSESPTPRQAPADAGGQVRGRIRILPRGSVPDDGPLYEVKIGDPSERGYDLLDATGVQSLGEAGLAPRAPPTPAAYVTRDAYTITACTSLGERVVSHEFYTFESATKDEVFVWVHGLTRGAVADVNGDPGDIEWFEMDGVDGVVISASFAYFVMTGYLVVIEGRPLPPPVLVEFAREWVFVHKTLYSGDRVPHSPACLPVAEGALTPALPLP